MAQHIYLFMSGWLRPDKNFGVIISRLSPYRINPVLGCVEGPKPDPMAGMTDEQKEYEAIKLVNLIDQMSRQGVVQPMRVGQDGRPHPLEHVLELAERPSTSAAALAAAEKQIDNGRKSDEENASNSDDLNGVD